MKVKSPHATAGIGKLHGYLGHFSKPQHINRGHNSDPVGDLVLPSDKRRQRLHEEFVAGVAKDAEAGRNPGTQEVKERPLSRDELLQKRLDAAAKRAEDSSAKNMNIPVWSR